MQFLIDHYQEIVALLGVAWTLVSGIVALTPSKADDAFLARLMQRASFLAPRNHPARFSMPGTMPKPTDEDPRGSALLALLLCVAPLLVACGHSKAIVAIETARAAACIEAERKCIERAEAGRMSVADARACVSCVRSTCDAIHERVVAQ